MYGNTSSPLNYKSKGTVLNEKTRLYLGHASETRSFTIIRSDILKV